MTPLPIRWLRCAAVLAAGLVAPAAAQGPPTGIAFERSAAGRTFVTADGRALYWSRDELAAQAITCIEECLLQRSPLAAPADASPPPGWSTVVRPDGSRQWAKDGKPLYIFAGDTYPGARLGAGGAWVLSFETADLPAGFSVQSNLLGRVLADHKGRTIYTRSAAAPAAPDTDWQPLVAPWLAAAEGEWSTAPLPDGTRQWLYKGQPLARYARDRDPQDVRGHGLDGGAWTAVILEPPPGLPAWMSVQRVDLGWVFADGDGMTLYAPANAERIKTAQTCTQACMEQYWRPVL
ncbi:MAG: hypothetical protein SFV21_16360, partial [Rhodospirillaceae bacterium]|nr:hypothetical protein [Rhodospirillaceae bacterium]